MDFKAINEQLNQRAIEISANIHVLKTQRAEAKKNISINEKDLNQIIGQMKAVKDLEPLIVKEIEEAKNSDQPTESQGA